MDTEKVIKEQLSIVDDTVAFYGRDPAYFRSVDADGTPFYQLGDNKCGIGRFLSQKDLNYLNKSSNGCNNISSIFEVITTVKIKKFPVQFWDRIQILHDIKGNWGTNGLSRKGRSFVSRLKNDIKTGKYL